MPATRPRVPGWHPDPQDPASLRHWDGRRWGAERRPRPSWAPPAPEGPDLPEGGGDGGGGGRGRWWLVASIALLLGLVVVSAPVWLGSGPDIPPRSVADAEFTTEAERICARRLPALREDRPETREDTGTEEAFARRIDAAADGLEKLVAELRAVPVAATDGDAGQVDGWLDDWDAYVAVGRRYAERTRAGDDDASNDARAEAAPLERRIFLFARSNDMDSCTL
jgi:hypothetical protein